MQPGVVPGAVLELHAAKALSGADPGINSPLTTEWFDTSGNGNHGTLTSFTGTPWVGAGTPSAPYALAFAGDGDVVRVPHAASLALGADFTVEFWTKDLSAVGGNVWLACKGPTDVPGYTGLIPAIIAGVVRASLGAWFTNATDQSYHIADLTALHHILLTRIAGQCYTYVDGAQRGSPVANSYNCSGLTGRWNLGSGPGGEPLDGQQITVRQYPFALTPEQVAQNRNAGPLWAPAVSGLPVIGSPILQGMRV